MKCRCGDEAGWELRNRAQTKLINPGQPEPRYRTQWVWMALVAGPGQEKFCFDCAKREAARKNR